MPGDQQPSSSTQPDGPGVYPSVHQASTLNSAEVNPSVEHKPKELSPKTKATSANERSLSLSSESEPKSMEVGYRGMRLYNFKGDMLRGLGLKKVKCLRSTSTGKYYLTRSRRDRHTTVKMKVFNLKRREMSKLMAEKFFDEVSILREFRHAHIIKNIIPVQDEKCAAICMDHHPRGSLEKFLGTFEGQHIFTLFEQLVSACLHIHSKNIIHRDITCANILMKNRDHIVLSEFDNACRVMPGEKVTGFIGTDIMFMAPEVRTYGLTTMPYDGKKADSYSCGVVLWSLLFGQCPRWNTRLQASIHRISQKRLHEDDMRLMVLKLLIPEAEIRPYLNHAFPPGVVVPLI